jgi:hypothetical protein
MLPAQIFEMRKRTFIHCLAQLGQNAEEILKLYELFI